MLDGLIEGGRRFALADHQLILTTPMGQQKGYNIGNAFLEVAGDRVIINAALRYLQRGSARARDNWRMLKMPSEARLDDFLPAAMDLHAKFTVNSWGELYTARLDLDEKAQAELLVWLDSQQES